MFYRIFKKLRRSARNWTTDVTRSDRNAVIQRIVTAAAAESKDRLNGGDVRRTATPPPMPSPLASQLLGRDAPEIVIPAAQIGQRAHEIWLRNGQPAGTASADWIQAEAELRAEREGSRG